METQVTAPRAHPRWHVSPVVDALAYHWSWLLMLVPLLMMGETHPGDYLVLFLATVAGNFAHQALTLPLVYLDPEVRAAHGLRLVILPGLVLALLVGNFFLYRADFELFKRIAFPLSVAGYIWNFWHVYMQKYGILRLYSAKSGVTNKVPGWVDRLLVFSWLPLAALAVELHYKDVALREFKFLEGVVVPIITFLEEWRLVLWPVAIALAAFSLVAFFLHEWRVHRLRNVARLSMGLGMTGLSASLACVNPIKAIIAFGFSHVLEYVVFVWAVERKQSQLAPSSSRFVRMVRSSPLAVITTFCLFVGGIFFALSGWSSLFAVGTGIPHFGYYPVAWLLAVLALHLSMVHFWLDGFLWKMRRPELRAIL